LLQDALDIFGDRPAALGNELTKLFESVQRGSLAQLLSNLDETDLRGEFVVVIAGQEK
jgi:16S rRNA (cytidine1402-2'-O)-methyltransferase